MDFIRSVIDTRGASVSIEHLEGRIFRETESAMNLDRAVDHVMHNSGAVKFNERDLNARILAAIHLPGCVEGHQSRCIDLCCGVGDPVLNCLFLCERLAERDSREGASAHHLETALRHSKPSHAMLNP